MTTTAELKNHLRDLDEQLALLKRELGYSYGDFRAVKAEASGVLSAASGGLAAKVVIAIARAERALHRAEVAGGTASKNLRVYTEDVL